MNTISFYPSFSFAVPMFTVFVTYIILVSMFPLFIKRLKLSLLTMKIILAFFVSVSFLGGYATYSLNSNSVYSISKTNSGFMYVKRSSMFGLSFFSLENVKFDKITSVTFANTPFTNSISLDVFIDKNHLVTKTIVISNVNNVFNRYTTIREDFFEED